MILRTILHKYLLDDVLPAEHVQDWVEWTEEVREHFAVDHDPDTGEHRTILVPVAAAVVHRIQDVSGKMAYLVRAKYGFETLEANESGDSAKLNFTLPSNVRVWQGRFTARWKFPERTNAAPTLAPVVLRNADGSGTVWLHGPKDKDLADDNGYTPIWGGTLVVTGLKD